MSGIERRLTQLEAASGPAPRCRHVVDDDLHAAVLRLTHARACGDQKVRFTEARNTYRGTWNTVANKLTRHRLGASNRQPLIVPGRGNLPAFELPI